MRNAFLIIGLLIGLSSVVTAQPAPTQSPSPTALTASTDTKPADPKAVKTKASGLKKEDTSTPAGAITIPIEKANPIKIPKIEKPPVIDGKLDDEVWKQAVLLKDFQQRSPGDNTPPSKPTEVRIAYDPKFLYFAFMCFDEPDKVRATLAKRDNVFGEDNVRVFLDTFNDKRRAYILGFNPFGIQQDAIFTEGINEDYNFDIVMESKGVMTPDGWSVEVAIPFKSLRYTAGKDKVWGIQIYRNIDRFNDELDSWMPNDRNNPSILNQAGHVTGLEGIQTQRQLEVTPSLTISETGQQTRTFSLYDLFNDPTLVDPGHFVNQPVKFEPGVTIKLGITPTITLDAAINPDFAQVEADAPVVVANQRFPIFFAEKRPFFLEGIDYFQSPLNAVHTRTIVDPDFAVKLTGKQGRNTFAIMFASDKNPGDFSDEERSDPFFVDNFGKLFDKNATVGVLRLKRDIGRESSVGVIATSYNFPDKYNQLGGFDGRFKLNPQTIFQFQVLGTKTHTFFFNPNAGRSEDRIGNALGYYWLLDYTGKNYGWFVSGVGRTSDYRAFVGFTRRTNTNINEAFFRYSTEPNPKAKYIIKTQVNNYNSINYDYHGRIQNYFNEVTLNLNMQGSTFFQAGINYSYERVFEKEFGPVRDATAQFCHLPTRFCGFYGDDNERSAYRKQVWAYSERNFNKHFYAYIFGAYGWGQTDYDFGALPKYPRVSPSALADPTNPAALQDPGPGNALDLDMGFTYKPIDPLNMTIGYTKSRLVRNDTGRVAFDDNIVALRGTYQFTRFTFARARIDYDSLASSVTGQLLAGWTPSPGTAFYVGYNDFLNYNGFNMTNPSVFIFDQRFFQPGLHRSSREFFIKMSYLFRKSF